MAKEGIRGCGYRKVGGLYLVGSYIPVPCDRLPYPLEVCPVCGSGIKISRGFVKIIPYRLFGDHEDCHDVHRPCRMCDPGKDVAFIMGVGEKYYPTPEDFLKEGLEMGVSKRIPFIPKEMELGKTDVYLAHPKACEVKVPPLLQHAMAVVGGEDVQNKLLDAEKVEKAMGIFAAFTPQRVEKLIWKSQATKEELAKLEKRGITPVVIKDGDKDHA